MALLATLVILLVVGASAAQFIWFMNQQQTRAGMRLRSAAALNVAEAGVHRALAILEADAAATGFRDRRWRPSAHAESLPVGPFEGRFTLSLSDEADGAVLVTSAGEVSGARHRLRARVYLASPALLAGLYASSVIWFGGPPGATFVLPSSAALADRPWVHVAAGKGIRFASPDVILNNASITFEVAAGPMGAEWNGGARLSSPGPVRLLLAPGADLVVGEDRRPVDEEKLRAMGMPVQRVVLTAGPLPGVPRVDRAYYQAVASANTANAGINEAAGKYLGDNSLVIKRDSLYSRDQFEQLQGYLRGGHSRPLQGIVYVSGAVALAEAEHLRVTEGALITEGLIRLGRGAFLEITHTPRTRMLPGLLVHGGALVLAEGARARVHGLVMIDRLIDVGARARVDVVGAVLGDDPTVSFRNLGGTVVIRYDPAVMGTPGLRLPDGSLAVAWVASWEEVP